jgi:hypothetical protein
MKPNLSKTALVAETKRTKQITKRNLKAYVIKILYIDFILCFLITYRYDNIINS